MSLQESIVVPILSYPAIRGSVQPIYHLFCYLEMPFKQQVVLDCKETEASFDSGYPRLTYGELVLTESITIFRHICRVAGRNDLLGLTPQNRAIINEFMFRYTDIKRIMIKKIIESAYKIWQNPKLANNIKLETLKTIVEQQCPVLLKVLQMFTKNKSWTMGYMTILDFFFYEICFYLKNFLSSILVNHPIYRKFLDFCDFFQRQQFYYTFKIKAPEKKIFMPFKDQNTYHIIKNIWQGKQQVLV